MKKITSIATLIMLMIFISSVTFAQEASVQTGKTKTTAVTATKAPGTGCCAKTNGTAKEKCSTFVDKNGDGVCDNCKSANCENKGKNCGGNGKCGNGKTNCCGQGNQNHGANCPNKPKTN